MTSEEYKRLTKIDDKMLNNEDITEEERKERTNLIIKLREGLNI
jgi:hypothetical protein